MTRAQSHSDGFTLIELLVVIFISALLLGVISVNLGKPQTIANVSTGLDTLQADLKSAQILAMAGDKGSQTADQAHGIFFQANQYTLFAGTTYNSLDSYNFVVTLPTNTTLATTFPSTQVVFNKGAGDVQGFVNGSNTITLTSGTVTHTITVSRFGALVVN